MISLPTPQPPYCLEEFAARKPLPEFDSLSFNECKHRLREILADNQYFQCAYCEAPIEDAPGRFHLDHMQPQSAAPQRRFDITNLVASCDAADTCGHRHGNFPVPEGLNPYRAEDLHTAFQCDSLGELHPDQVPEALCRFAFNQLNLNAIGLKTQRAKVIAAFRSYTISAGTNARKKFRTLSTRKTGFRSLFHQELSRFGFPLPS